MALDYQLVPIQWQGMDTKTDEKQLVPGKVALLQNMWMDRTGIIKKRYGFTQVTGINSNYAYGLAEYNSAPIAFSTSRSSIGGPIANSLASNFVQTLTESTATPNIPYLRAAMGISTGSQNSLLVTDDAANTLTLSLLDNATNNLVTAKLVWPETTWTFCCFNATYPGFVYISSTGGSSGLRIAVCPSSGVLPSTSSVIDAGPTNGVCRAFCYNNIVYVAYLAAGTTWKVAGWDITNSAALSPVTLTTAGPAIASSADVYVDANGVYCAYYVVNGANYDAVCKRFSLNLVTLVSTRTLAAGGGPVAAGFGAGKIAVVAENDKIGLFTSQVSSSLNATEAVKFFDGTISVQWQNISLVSRAFLIKRAGVNVPAVLIQSDLSEGSVVLFQPKSFAAATYTADCFGGGFFGRLRRADTTLGTLESFLNDGKTQMDNFAPRTVLAELSYTHVTSGAKNSSITARIVKWETVASPPISLEIANSNIVGNFGSDVRFFDGFYPVKSGFYNRPQKPILISNAVNATGLGAGTYLYCIVAEYLDNNGNICRSAPSDSLSVTVPIGPNKVDLEFYIPPFNSFSKITDTSIDAGVYYVLFRTFANGTVFYRVQGGVTLISNSGSSFSDTTPDATLIGSTPLYTTGGILENVPGPLARSVAVAKSRVFVVSAQDDELWYSKKFVPGELPSFNEALAIKLDAQGGKAISVVEMDDKVIILKRSALLGIYGDGPDETGAGPFQGPQVISTELGLVSDSASVLTDDGIMFKSDRGIYLLNRGMQTEYIGKEVQEFNGDTVVSAHNLRDRDQTFFWTTQGNTCVYDSFHRIWSVYTGLVCQDACLVNGVPHFLSGAAGAGTLLLKEDKTVFADNGVAVPIIVRSGWMSMAGIQGFQRIRKLNFVGKSYAAHSVTVKLYYDFNDTVFETITVASATIMPGADSNYQYQIRPKRQKCEAFKFELSVSGTNQAFELSQFALEVGVKPKSNRMAAYKRVSS